MATYQHGCDSDALELTSPENVKANFQIDMIFINKPHIIF